MRSTTKTNILLWTVQGLLTLMFLFAGVMKLVLPAAALTQQAPLPVALLRFVGVAEALGGLGLLLPGLLHVRRYLTPIAAAGLVIVMSGAVGVTLAAGQGATSLMPAVVGILAALVAAGRRSWLAEQRSATRDELCAAVGQGSLQWSQR
jgi:uncharacterized membrane protein YphA (DoxX/SURF4 family)